MDQQAARDLAERWIALWNARDLDGVLRLFAEDATFTSPTAARLLDGSGGTVRGRAALCDYWSLALSRNPGLRFDLLEVYAGIDRVIVGYRHQTGLRVCEVLVVEGDLIVEGHATHLV